MPDALFELIPREHLADILTHIHSYTGLPLRLIDPAGRELMGFSVPMACCRLLRLIVLQDTGTTVLISCLS